MAGRCLGRNGKNAGVQVSTSVDGPASRSSCRTFDDGIERDRDRDRAIER